MLTACGGSSPPAPTIRPADDTYTVTSGSTTTLEVLSNDTVAGGAETLSLVSPPSHGSVVTQGSTFVYTPAPGFYGEDQFTYRVAIGSASASAAVKVTVETSFELSGSIVPKPNALTAVTAQVGDRQFKVNADEQGRYKIAIRTSQPTAFVTVSAQESGARSAAAYGSLIGDTASLLALPTSPRIDEAQWPALQLNALTTARMGLQKRLGGVARTTSELKAALARQDPTDLMDITALLGHVYADPSAVPATVANAIDLAASPAGLSAVQQHWERTGGSIHDARLMSSILDQLTVTAPPVVSAKGTRLVSMFQGVNALLMPEGSDFELRPDGSAMGFVWTWASSTAIAGRWSTQGNVLSISLASPLALDGQYRVRTVQYRQIRTVDPQPSPQLMMRWETDCDLQSNGYCPTPGFTPWVAVVSFDVERDRQPLRFEDFIQGSRWAGLLLTKSPALADYMIGVGEQTFDGTPNAAGMTGQLLDGRWVLSTDTHNYRYTRLGAGPEEGMEYWLAELQRSGLTTRSKLLMVAKGSPVPALDVNAAARRWGGQQQSANGSSDPSGRRTYLYPTILHKDGRQTYDFGNGEVDRGVRWSLSGDGRTILSHRLPDNQTVVLLSLVRRVSGGYLAMQDGGGLVRVHDLGPAD